jgi:hypothetical protein
MKADASLANERRFVKLGVGIAVGAGKATADCSTSEQHRLAKWHRQHSFIDDAPRKMH